VTIEESRPLWTGVEPRECGEHRTVGSHRAWCFDCSEWCYSRTPEMHCRGCELPGLRQRLEALEADREGWERTAQQEREKALKWEKRAREYASWANDYCKAFLENEAQLRAVLALTEWPETEGPTSWSQGYNTAIRNARAAADGENDTP